MIIEPIQAMNDRAALVTVFSSLASEPKINREIMIEAHSIACDIEDIDRKLALNHHRNNIEMFLEPAK